MKLLSVVIYIYNHLNKLYHIIYYLFNMHSYDLLSHTFFNTNKHLKNSGELSEIQAFQIANIAIWMGSNFLCAARKFCKYFYQAAAASAAFWLDSL